MFQHDLPHKMQVRALARITFSPLVDMLPCIGAVSVSLLEEPYLDLSLSFMGSPDLMGLPGLNQAVKLVAQKVRAG